MTHRMRNSLAVLLISAATASCSDNNSTPTVPPTVPPVAKTEDQFGANFGVAYRKDPNTDATDPTPGDIIPLSLTTDPVVL